MSLGAKHIYKCPMKSHRTVSWWVYWQWWVSISQGGTERVTQADDPVCSQLPASASSLSPDVLAAGPPFPTAPPTTISSLVLHQTFYSFLYSFRLVPGPATDSSHWKKNVKEGRTLEWLFNLFPQQSPFCLHSWSCLIVLMQPQWGIDSKMPGPFFQAKLGGSRLDSNREGNQIYDSENHENTFISDKVFQFWFYTGYQFFQKF